MAAIVASTANSGATVRAADQTYQRISGSGSTWAANFIDAVRVNVKQFGITVDFNPNGSSAGRKDYLNGVVDWAASDIPFQFNPEDGSAPENPAPDSYAYIPVTAGGTAFMYNLKINGKRVTNLRLSGANVSAIFTGKITQWNDPAIQADNPGLTMPARAIVPVVRSDGSGSTAQFTLWMIKTHPEIWNDYCKRSGRAPACGFTSFYPTIQGMIAQQGDLGVSGYISQGFAEGAIGYINYSYALGAQFPVVKMLNAAGYYTEPTPQNVAVSLLKAQINNDASDPSTYLTQNLDGVYADTDPRNYQLSSYSYMIIPTVLGGQFNESKGYTLGAFAYYAMCQAQEQSASLGYSPMPINLVQASFDQIRKIPGVAVQNIDIAQCNNPTFSADGTNTLADQAPQPKACDQQGATQCPDGTAGLANVPTAINPAAQGGSTATTAPSASATTTPGGPATPDPAAPGVTTPGQGASVTTAAAGGASGTGTKTPSGTPTSVAGSSASGGVAPGTTLAGVGVPGDGTDTATPGDGTAVAPSASCDADTGQCAVASDSPAAVAVAGAGPSAANTPQAAPVQATTLRDTSGTAGSLALKFIVVLLTLAAVLVPAMAWRYYSSSPGHGAIT